MGLPAQPFQSLLEQILRFAPRLLAALVIFLTSLYLSGLASHSLRRMLDKRASDPEIKLLVSRLVKWSIVTLGTVIALDQIDFDLAGFLAGLGIVGFTIGFALQDVSKNFVAGVLLLLQQPFDIGDTIEIGDFRGRVTNITVRATELRTPDGLHVLIPNGDVYITAIKNFSKTSRRRLEVAMEVAYNSDLAVVTQAIQTALAGIPGVIKDDPPPKVVFSAFSKSSVDLTAYYWIELAQLTCFDAQDQAVKAIKTALEQARVEIPINPVRT